MTSILHVLILVGIICQTYGQVQVDPNCDFYQFMDFGTTYYVYSPNFPSNYLANTKCRWIAKVPVGYKIKLDCTTVVIPQSQNCVGDRLPVSLTGNPNFLDGQNYCGTGTLFLTSSRTSMSIGLFTLSNQGRFSCSIYAVVDPTIYPTIPRPPPCDCGQQYPNLARIVGGTPTRINQFPWMAALIVTSPFLLLCGATIIHDHYAITAAHCVTNRDAKTLGLLVGDYDVSSGLDTQANDVYKLLNYTSNAYNQNTQINDIAIVRTRYDMTYSFAVSPICLPFRLAQANNLLVAATTLVLGWGSTEFMGPQSAILLATNLTVVTNAVCQTEHTSSGSNTVIYPSEICTSGAEVNDGLMKDACQSDSGGPLAYLDSLTNRYILVGIVSFGIGCGAGYPGVNTRVTSFMAWIINNTPDATYCIK